MLTKVKVLATEKDKKLAAFAPRRVEPPQVYLRQPDSRCRVHALLGLAVALDKRRA